MVVHIMSSLFVFIIYTLTLCNSFMVIMYENTISRNKIEINVTNKIRQVNAYFSLY